MTNMPFIADPFEPGLGVNDDPVLRAEAGQDGHSVSAHGTEVGIDQDDEIDHQVISSDDLDQAAQDSQTPDGE